MEDAQERPTGARVAGGARAPLIAAIVICAVTLPMSVAVLFQVVGRGLAPAATTWILALLVVLHLAGLACARLPRVAFAVGSAAMLGLALTSAPGTSSAALLPSAVTYVLLEWQMGATQRRPTAVSALGVGVLGAGVITAVDAVAHDVADPFLIGFEAIALVAVVAAGWAFGVLSGQRRIASAALAERRVRDAVTAERARIGRDLHDVVSHSLTVMIAQAEAARVLVREPDAAVALERVTETGRAAMQGLRGMLHVLEADDPDALLTPSPDLRGLTGLVERAGSPEHRTAFAEYGEPRKLPPDAELALFRAAQEALTNAVRHVRPPVEIRVELAWHPREVVLTVSDDGGAGRSGGDDGTGAGLIGMAERVRQAGGTLEIHRGHGWTVRVAMPIEEAR